MYYLCMQILIKGLGGGGGGGGGGGLNVAKFRNST